MTLALSIGLRIGHYGVSAPAAVADTYAIAGDSPELVADFPADYFRKASVASDFDTLFTYTGASLSTTVDSSGNIVWKNHNLCLQSEDFSTSWTTSNVTISTNATTAPDGNTTADLMYPSSTGTFRWKYQTRTTATDILTRSVFAKAENLSWVYIDATGGGTKAAWFNLSAGTVGTVDSGYTASIEDVGSGWWKCTITGDAAVSNAFNAVIGVSDGDNTYTATANGTDGIYLWGAHVYHSDLGGMQDNPSDFPTYTPTTTAAVYGPRRHHHIYNGSSWVDQGIEIESEARTNLVADSNDFTGYTKVGCTVDADAGTSPDGTTNADRINVTAASGVHEVYKPVVGESGYEGALSIYMKDDGAGYGFLCLYSGLTSFVTISVNLSTGAITHTQLGSTGSPSASETYTVDMGSGWWRIVVTGIASALSIARYIMAGASVSGTPTYSNGRPTFTAVAGEDVLIYGGQFESNGALTASSYIPTSGGTATRTAETLTIAGVDTPANTTAMSFHMKGTMNYADEGAAQDVLIYWYQASNNFIYTRLDTSSTRTGQIRAYQRETTSGQDNVDGPTTSYSPGPAVPFNIATRNGSTFINVAIDGTAATENATPTLLTDLSATALDVTFSGSRTIDTFRLWGKDIQDSGIETAST